MKVACEKCRNVYDDAYRSTICPHDMFLANDGHNNFTMGPDAANRLVKDWESTVEVARDGEGRFIIVSVTARAEEGHELHRRANVIAREISEDYAAPPVDMKEGAELTLCPNCRKPDNEGRHRNEEARFEGEPAFFCSAPIVPEQCMTLEEVKQGISETSDLQLIDRLARRGIELVGIKHVAGKLTAGDAWQAMDEFEAFVNERLRTLEPEVKG